MSANGGWRQLSHLGHLVVEKATFLGGSWITTPGQVSDRQGTYHLKTRLDGNRVGLLVDSGAHDNLIGGKADTAGWTASRATTHQEAHHRRSRPWSAGGDGRGTGANPDDR